MFGSQVLETAIGLVLMFFIIATASSMIAEIISRLTHKRATDLEGAIGGMLGKKGASDEDFKAALALFKATSVYQAATQAAGGPGSKTRQPSYLSAKSFADAIVEVMTTVDNTDPKKSVVQSLDELPANLRTRVEPLVKEAGDDLVAFKSGLERWFDESMARAEGAYKRWTTTWLFLIGLVIAGAGNASTVDVAHNLYVGSATRAAVVEAANGVVSNPDTATQGLKSIQDTTDQLTSLQLPVGWTQTARDNFDLSTLGTYGTIFGWLLTALLVMLGAPFWFDLLTRLVSLRSAGTKPPTAAEDPASATRLQLASQPAQASTDRAVAIAQAAAQTAGQPPPAGEAQGAGVAGGAPGAPASALARPAAPTTTEEVTASLARMLGAQPPTNDNL